jgi:hypothetical protein
MPRRGGLCTPAMTESRQARHYSLLPPAHRQPTRGNEVPWHPDARTKRTRRPRPSDKIAYPRTSYRKAISPGSLHPPEGRALHAREGRDGFDRGMCPVGHRPMVIGPGGKGMPRHSYGLARRTHRVRPSEKTAFRVIPGFSPQGLSPGPGPPEGRALHAREGRDGFDRGMCPVGHRPMVIGPGGKGMPRHSYGLARRTHRVRPSEETAPRVIPGFSPQGLSPGPGPPGGAGSARPQ